MDILTDEQHQVVGFIAACNRNYYNPTAQQVMLWHKNPKPTEAVYRTVRRQIGPATPVLQLDTSLSRMIAATVGESMRPIQEALAAGFRQNSWVTNQLGVGTTRMVTDKELVKPAETLLEHLIRLTWLEEVPTPSGSDPGLRLTELGRALLRDVDLDDSEEDVSVVLLGKEDPLAYPTLVGQLAAAGPGLLVDPYLKLADLHTIVISTQLTRLLVSGKSNNRSVISSMQAYLDSTSLGRQVQVRASTELHDRVLLADDEDVLTLGTSLNGVGRTTTVMTPIPSPARESLRDEYERLWTESALVGPPPVAQEEEEKVIEDDGRQDSKP